MNIRTWAKLALATALGTTSVLGFACSSSDESAPPLVSAPGTKTMQATGDASVTDSGAHPSDASDVDVALPDVDAAGVCSTATQRGAEVSELGLYGQQPAANGGKVSPGTYILTDLETYETSDAGPEQPDSDDGVTSAPTGYAAASTLVLNADGSFWLVEQTGTTASGLGAATTTGGVYTTSSASLIFAFACPAAVAGTTSTSGYDAAGGELVLYRSSHLEIFQVQPMP